jgi:hypothetical protein
MPSVDQRATYHLQALIGLPLVLYRRLAGWANQFQFGVLHFEEGFQGGDGLRGDYCLLVFAPWRLSGPHGIVTGSRDVEELPDDIDVSSLTTWEAENYNLQDERMRSFFLDYIEDGTCYTSAHPTLIVEAAVPDSDGGFKLYFTHGYSLSIFPDSAALSDWQLYSCGDAQRFEVAGGAIRTDVGAMPNESAG